MSKFVEVQASRLSRASLHDRIITELRDMILHGDLPPGVPFVEAELCARFAVSRTPLREALKVLAAEGLVTLRAHRSPIVAPMDRTEIAEVFAVLATLESMAGRFAAERADAAGEAELAVLHRDMLVAQADGDRPRYFRLNMAFHLAFSRLSGNAVLHVTIAGLQARVTRARATANVSPARWREAADEHGALVTAYATRKPEQVAQLLEAHLQRTADAVLAFLDREERRRVAE
jgi:DNA-binding GntR family transcriptional regulator